MIDFKVYAPCGVCKKKRFFIRKRLIEIPVTGGEMTSQKLMCTKCAKDIILMLKPK